MRARPGYASFKTVGDGPLRCIAARDGLFGNAALILSNTTAYLLTAAAVLTTLSGTVPGDGLVDVAFGQDADLNSVAYVATGTALYKVLGTAISQDTTFPGTGASSVAFIGGYFIAVEASTDKFYYLIPGGVAWKPLDFASAEYAPDPLVAVRVRGDQIAFLGSSTFQVFALSGTSANPIEPYGGLNEDVGCRSRTTAVVCGSSLIFVDNESGVRRWDGGELRQIASPGLAEQIAAVDPADLVAWTFSIPGHRFYVLKVGDTATWVYDLEEVGERWVTFDSPGYDYWRAQLGCNIGDTVLTADSIASTVYRLDVASRTDAGEAFGVEFSAWIEGADVPQPLASLTLVCDLGDAPRTGQGSSPIVQMKYSDNLGKTWSAWRERPMGQTGVYGVFPRWNGLGTVPALFGRIVRFRVSDPIGRVFKAVKANLP